MDLKDMQSIWQNAGRPDKSRDDLRKMMRLPAVRRIRARLLVESACFLFVLVVYYDWFDGAQKPFYANVLLVVALLSVIAKDVTGYIHLLRPAVKSDIRASLSHLLSRTERLARWSLVLSGAYGLALIIYFTSVIHFTREKGFILTGVLIILTQLILWSHRIWRKTVKNLRKQLEVLSGE
jgi:hypothetical protein